MINYKKNKQNLQFKINKIKQNKKIFKKKTIKYKMIFNQIL